MTWKVSQLLVRASLLWQVIDVLTDVLYVYVLVLKAVSLAADTAQVLVSLIAAFLLLWAVIGGVFPALRSDGLEEIWTGGEYGIAYYKLGSVAEAALELLVVFAARYQQEIRLLDWLVIVASAVLMLVDTIVLSHRGVAMSKNDTRGIWAGVVVMGVLLLISRLVMSPGILIALLVVAWIIASVLSAACINAIAHSNAHRLWLILYLPMSLILLLPVLIEWQSFKLLPDVVFPPPSKSTA